MLFRSYEGKLKEIGLETLEERRHQQDMAMMYKIMNGKDGLENETWFERATDGPRRTRATDDDLNVKINHGRLEIQRGFFSIRVCEDWNRIPPGIKSDKVNQRIQTRVPAI